jgi:hypothetical protein
MPNDQRVCHLFRCRFRMPRFHPYRWVGTGKDGAVMAGTVGHEWRKSGRCDSANCVEVAYADGRIAIRDGKDPEGPRLIFAVEEWTSFVDWVRQCAR